MMKVQVITVATSPKIQVSRFMRSCIKFGFWPVVLGINRSLNGSEDRFLFYNEWFSDKRHTDDFTHILVVDSMDILFAGTLDEIVAAYETYKSPIVFCAERNCWPKPELSEHYPSCDFPYRFLNGGGFIGDKDSVMRLCSKLPVSGENDQLTMTRLFLDGNNGISLDYHCRIFQCLLNVNYELEYFQDRIYNQRTCTHPLIFHGNGMADMSQVLLHPYCRL